MLTEDALLDEIRYLRRYARQLEKKVSDLELELYDLKHPERAPEVEEWERRGWTDE